MIKKRFDSDDSHIGLQQSSVTFQLSQKSRTDGHGPFCMQKPRRDENQFYCVHMDASSYVIYFISVSNLPQVEDKPLWGHQP